MRGLIVFSDHMEDVEALATRALLVRAGFEMDSATINDNLEVISAFGQLLKVDKMLKDINTNDYDFFVIPGGAYVAKIIDKDVIIKRFAKAFNEQNKIIAAICAGPRFLGQAELLDDKKYTCFPGSEKDMPLGKYLPKKKAVKDGNIITARGAGVVYEFVYEIVKALKDEKSAKALLARIQY